MQSGVESGAGQSSIIPDTGRFLDEHRKSALYKDWSIGAGILLKAQIPEILEVFSKIKQLNTPDIDIRSLNDSKPTDTPEGLDKRFTYQPDGTVVAPVTWNYKIEPNKSTHGSATASYNAFYVTAIPALRALLVEPKDGHEKSGTLIPHSTWSKDNGRETVADAIIEAYNNPLRISEEINSPTLKKSPLSVLFKGSSIKFLQDNLKRFS